MFAYYSILYLFPGSIHFIARLALWTVPAQGIFGSFPTALYLLQHFHQEVTKPQRVVKRHILTHTYHRWQNSNTATRYVILYTVVCAKCIYVKYHRASQSHVLDALDENGQRKHYGPGDCRTLFWYQGLAVITPCLSSLSGQTLT